MKYYFLFNILYNIYHLTVWKLVFPAMFAQRREESEHNKRELMDVAAAVENVLGY